MIELCREYFICTVHLTVCSYHVTYAFKSESTLYNCLNIKELLPQKRREIWSLSNRNGTQTHNNLVRKRTLNHLTKLAKWLNYVVSIWLVWLNDRAFVYELSGRGFKSCRSHSNFKYRACFQQWVHWYSGNYSMWIHSRTRTWYDKNMKSS